MAVPTLPEERGEAPPSLPNASSSSDRLISTAPTASTVPSVVAQKRILLIRHGESAWNEWRKRTSLWNGDLCCCVLDPEIVDPELSSRGLRQCEKLRESILQQRLLERVDLARLTPAAAVADQHQP